MGADWRQQEQEERMLALLAILDRVASGETDLQDAAELAAALGLTQLYSTRKEMA